MNFQTPGMGTYGSTWQAHGYSGCGNVAELIDSEKGRPAIVVGSSFQVFADLSLAQPRLPNHLIFAVNDIGMFLPHVDHWVSLHYPNLKVWQTVRWLHSRPAQPNAIRYHSYETENKPNTYTWDGLNPMFALSGYFAMQIAWIMGCHPIYLCGCPGSPARRFFEATPVLGTYEMDGGIRKQVISEMERLPEFKNSVSSMSGWTREFFGGVAKWRHSRR
jgi:hypothetical protein